MLREGPGLAVRAPIGWAEAGCSFAEAAILSQMCDQLQRGLGERGHPTLFSINVLVVLRVETALLDGLESKPVSPSTQAAGERRGTGRAVPSPGLCAGAWPWPETMPWCSRAAPSSWLLDPSGKATRAVVGPVCSK